MASLTAAACAAPSPEPAVFEPDGVVSDAAIFSMADVETVFAGYDTLGDYVERLSPTYFYWQTYSVTDDVYIQMMCEGEMIIVRLLHDVAAAVPMLREVWEGETPELPSDMLALPCLPAGVEWSASDCVLKPPRSVHIGDTPERLIPAFRADGTRDAELYTIAALNPDADGTWIASDQYWLGAYIEVPADEDIDYYVVYSWADVHAPVERREYWHLFYTVIGGSIDTINLSYDADLPEDAMEGDFMELPEAQGDEEDDG